MVARQRDINAVSLVGNDWGPPRDLCMAMVAMTHMAWVLDKMAKIMKVSNLSLSVDASMLCI